ncbi:hypothetical protein L1887_35092 [Cichorium endivia]|nr:hypothetical protein L1887_35092 [Cichorium endivia]
MATRSLEILKAIGVRGGVVSRTVEDGGVIRMKILVKRQQMDQVLEQVMKKIGDNKENQNKGNNVRQLSRSLASKSLEPQSEDKKKMKIAKSDETNRDCRSNWRPALQSIPEEF